MLLAGIAPIALFFSCGGAAAQSATDASGGLEQVTVTAEKRAESLQTTPVAITAYTDATIEKTGVSDIAALADKAPNVTFKFTAPVSGASDAATVFIRGIGQSDFALTTDPGVGVYVDGVYASRSVGGVLDVLDLERVEILRGPQGTLFGRNTIGGAVSLITKKPDFDNFSGSVAMTGGSFSRLDLRGALNIPLAKNLAFRIAASSKSEDGYVNTAFTAASPFYEKALTNLGNVDRQAVRGELLWDPIEDLEVTVVGDYSHVNENNAPATLVGVTGQTGPNDGPISFVYNAFQAPTTTLPGFANANYSPANFITGNRDTTYATGPNGTRLKSYGGALTLEYHVSPELELKSITAYHGETGTFARDADGSPVVLTDNIDTAYRHQQFTQELQAVGSLFNDRLKYAAGLYYLHEVGSDPLIVQFPATFGLLNISQDIVRNSSIAIYGQATYNITDALSITAGFRYTEDKKRFLTNQTLTITGPGGTALTGAPVGAVVPLVPPNSDLTRKFPNAAPHASIQYQFSEEAMVYGSYSEGFKSGGFNLRYVAPRAAVRTFGPEKVKSFEIGTKLENEEHTVRLNAAAFTTQYQNNQLTFFESLGAPVTANGGNARISGFETELTAIPLPNLDVTVNVAYLDAHYTSLVPGLNAGATTPAQNITLASRLPNTPKWTPSFDIDYTVPVYSVGKVMFAADGRYSSTTFNDAQNSVFLRQGNYAIFDASITYFPEKSSWSLRGYVDNLSNERYIVSGDSNYGIGFHEAEFNRPREYGAVLSYKF
jgi:iron complex outermembrane receptor protein